MEFQLIPNAEQESFFSYARAQRVEKAERDADVGDIVHFWDHEAAKCRAAMVLDVKWDLDCEADPDGQYMLRVFHREDATEYCVLHSEHKSSDTWHWPCGGH